jgi:hypothetical protein
MYVSIIKSVVLSLWMISFFFYFILSHINVKLFQDDNFCVVKIKYNMHSAQPYSVLYNNAVRPVRCECWQFTHMWKALAWSFYFRAEVREEVRVNKMSLTPPLFIEVSVLSQESERSCIYARCTDFSLITISVWYKEEINDQENMWIS